MSVEPPAAAALTPAAFALVPITPSIVVSLTKVMAKFSPLFVVTVMMPASFSILSPSFCASSFILSMQASTLPLSGPWTTTAPSGFGLPRPRRPSEMLLTEPSGSKPHLSLNSANFFWTSPSISFGSTNFFHSELCWSCVKLRPITISESTGRSERSSFAPFAVAPGVGTALPAPGSVPAGPFSAVLSAAGASDFFSLFLQAAALNDRASAATSQPRWMRTMSSLL